MRTIALKVERFPLARPFSISRGSKNEAVVVVCSVSEGAQSGKGECVPYSRYGESVESVAAAIEAARDPIEAGASRSDLLALMPPGAARNALDCALWDLEAKLAGIPVHSLVKQDSPRPLVTAVTISLDNPDTMAAHARDLRDCPLIKIKVGGSGDVARMRAVAQAAPRTRLIIDANEGWTEENIVENLAVAAECGAALVEQPLAAGQDGILREIPHQIPICADESLHSSGDLDTIAGLYDAVNIKLDKTGGLTAALDLRRRAREKGFGIMVGCMVGTSLAMAPAMILAQDSDFVDLDGPLLLANDRSPGLRYEGSLAFPPDSDLWG